MKDMPPEIDRDEIIVRVVIDKFLKNGRLHRRAFLPRVGKSGDISVLRHDFVGVDFCKNHAKKKVQKLESPNSRIYKGLAASRAQTFWDIGGSVKDSREQFLGHADACLGIDRQDGSDPADPELQFELDQRIDALLKQTHFFADPAPEEEAWTGPELHPPTAELQL